MARLRDIVFSLFRRCCLLLPIDAKKVVFSSFDGRGYSDNPKAIAEALLASGEKLKLQWLLKSPEDASLLPAGITPIPYNSLKQVYALSTAKVWVDNCRKDQRHKKPGQFYLQTWHGFALKRIEGDVETALEPDYVRSAKLDSALCDLIVSNSAFMTQIYRHSFWYDGEIAEFGSPRNDAFFHPDPVIPVRVRERLGLPQSRKLLLYAPTFRSDGATAAYALDVAAVLQACETRFGGEWSALIRLHPNVAAQSQGLFSYDGLRVLDATAYPDMQELLSAADLLITDYSSSMFDYALGGKPCIQFATDIADYKNDRNFYFPLTSLPFPLAQSNEALLKCVLCYDPAYWQERWKQFMQENGFCEDGNAAQRCAQWILCRVNGEKS